MKNFPVALQLFSVRENVAANFEQTLTEVKKMGYDGVELCGFNGKTAEQLRDICAETGLVPISAHIAFETARDNLNIFKEYAKVGCEYAVVPCLPEAFQPKGERFFEVFDYLAEFAKRAKDAGLKFCYHNHRFEFTDINGEFALDMIYRKIPSELLQTELDTCWVNAAGQNPVEYILKYSDRSEILHLKDFAGTLDSVPYAFKCMTDDERAKQGEFEFRPVGYGLQDMPAIISAAEKSNVKWLVVEQDRPTDGLTPMQCAEKSVKYLKGL